MIAKYRKAEYPGEWWLTDFTMDQVEKRLEQSETTIKILCDKNKKSESENARLRSEVERLGSDIDDVSCYAEKLSDWGMIQYRGMLDKINELEELVQEHQTYTPKQSIKEQP